MTNNSVKLIKPAWNETLKFLTGILDHDDAKNLVAVISENYFKKKPRRSSKLYAHYNPHIDDLYLSWGCIKDNPALVAESLEFRLKNFFSPRKISPYTIRKEIIKWQRVYGDHPKPFSYYRDFKSYSELIPPEKVGGDLYDLFRGIPSGYSFFAQAYNLKVGDTELLKPFEGFLTTASDEDPKEDIHATIRIIHSRSKPTTY